MHDASNIVDLALVRKSILYAKKYHGSQLRQTGEKYWHHPIGVAAMVAEVVCETNVIVAAVLHDTLEDTVLPLVTIEVVFGEVVASAVQCLTNKPGENLEDRVSDIVNSTIPPETEKILLVKLLDRVHNMRTLHVKKPEKRKQIVLETENILLPIAKDLAFHSIANEMQQLCQRYR